MITPPLHPVRARRGFTLVELLMVMAIMLVVMGLVIVAYPSLGKAGNLTNGTQSFVDSLNQARQSALAQNKNVEVRFYYLPGPTDGSTATAFRAMRVIVCDPSGNTSTNSANVTTYAARANPGLVQRLPVGVIIFSGTPTNNNGNYFSTLLPMETGASSSSPPNPTWPNVTTTTMPTTGTEYFAGSGTAPATAYVAFQFKPNGGTTLDPLGTVVTSGSAGALSDKWFMTFKTQTDPAPADNSKPSMNFITVLVDPLTGRVRTYRP